MERFTEFDFREMVARLAHEIRNPLATIQSGIQLVEHLAKPEGEILEILRGVLREVDRLDLVVHDLQELTLLERLPTADADVGGALGRAFDAMTATAAAAHVSLVDGSGPPVRSRIAPAHLELAIRELLSNAIRASHPESTVAIRWSSDGGRVAISVEDDGPGIPPERAGRVMRPFYSTFTHGTGLGLNKVLRICTIYGGELRWSNRDTGGCRFELDLEAA